MNPVERSAWGNRLRAEGRLEEALVCQQKALQQASDNWGIRVNYAVALQDMGFLLDAIEQFAEAARQSSALIARVNLAMARLRAGEFAEGFRGFLHRWQVPQWPQQPYQLPFPHLLDAGSVLNQPVVIMPDQGFGDTLMALPWMRWVCERNPQVTLLIRPPLLTLVRMALGDVCSSIESTTQKPFAGWLTGFDLPAVCPEVLSDYSHQRAMIESCLKTELNLLEGRRDIGGIVWRGNPDHSLDAWRSISTSVLVDVLAGMESSWMALFPDVSVEDQQAFQTAGISLERPMLSDFSDTAGYLLSCQTLLTVDTATVHLAGLLGIPTLLLVNAFGDWRWCNDATQSNWYPAVKIIRQARLGEWQNPLDIAVKLCKKRHLV